MRRQGYPLLLILALAGFVTSFGAHVVAVNLPSYAQVVGVGAFMIGVLIAVYDFAELFAKPVAGYMGDRRGMRLVLLGGLAIFILGSLLYFVLDPAWLIAVRFVQGLGAAALSTASITLVAHYFTEGRGRAFGIYNAIKGAGYVAAPAIGGIAVAHYGFSSIFLMAAAVGFVALVLALLLPRDSAAKAREGEELEFAEFFRIFRDPRLMPAYAMIFVNMLLVGVLFGFLPVYLHSIGYSAMESGLTVSVAAASYLLVQPLAGSLADRVPIGTTVWLALTAAALAIATASFLRGIPLLVCVAIAGMGVGAVWTNADALVSALSDRARLGASMGAAQSFKELGDMVGPLAIGAITQLFGVRTGFVTCGALALICVAALARVGAFRARRSTPGDEQQGRDSP